MQAKKILFTTDFSEASKGAMKVATALARDSGATLLIVHVEDLQPVVMGDGMYLPPPNEPNPELRKMLHQVVPADRSVPHVHLLRTGTPAREIIRVANEQKVDFIVMGTHGRTGLARLLMGSVAEAIVRQAPCPVLTIRDQHRLAGATRPDAAMSEAERSAAAG